VTIDLPRGLPPEAAFSGVSIDSRTTHEGDLFIAIEGERHDGHDHVQEALRKGAVAAVVKQRWLSGLGRRTAREEPYLPVQDTLKALQALARYHRRRLGIPVIGVTGSNGKTSTKEMIAAILSTNFRVLKSEASFNNHIGVPLTLLRLRRAHEVAIIEMGMNHSGEIAELCRIAMPTSGVITNVGAAHLEFMGDLGAIASAKGELAEAVGKGGFLALNADDQRVADLRGRTEARVITFGFGDGSDVRGESTGARDGVFGDLRIGGGPVIRLRVPGSHNLYNALAAAAVAEAMGVGPEQIRDGLEAYRGSRMRSEVVRIGPWIVLNDAYNANPASMERALETLRDWQNGRPHRRIAVLGDMLELGEEAPTLHQQLGVAVPGAGVEVLLAVGDHAVAMTDGALSAGMSTDRVFRCVDVAEAWVVLRPILAEDDMILLKGSRLIGLDVLVDRFSEFAARSRTGRR